MGIVWIFILLVSSPRVFLFLNSVLMITPALLQEFAEKIVIHEADLLDRMSANPLHNNTSDYFVTGRRKNVDCFERIPIRVTRRRLITFKMWIKPAPDFY